MPTPSNDALDRAEPPAPIATWLLVAANLAVALLVTGFIPNESTLLSLAWSRDAMAAGQWHLILTSMFVHGGILHLAFNMLALVSFGSIERRLGTTNFVIIYVAAGIGGALAHVAVSDIPAVGASGAIFGMLGVILVMDPGLELSVVGLPMPALVALTLYLSVVLLVPAFSDLLPIAHWAHIGGMVVGMAGGLMLDPRQGLTHLMFVGAAFAATLVLVGSLTGLDPQGLQRTWQADGLVGILRETWLTWLALAGIWLTVELLRNEQARREGGEL